MKPFRISKNNTVKATMSANGELLAAVYDSQFTTIGQIIAALTDKCRQFKGKAVFHVSLPGKCESKTVTKIIR